MSSGILHRPAKSVTGENAENARERARTNGNDGNAENARERRERARTPGAPRTHGDAENARERRERTRTPRNSLGVPRTPGQEAGIKTETLLYFILKHYINTL